MDFNEKLPRDTLTDLEILNGLNEMYSSKLGTAKKFVQKASVQKASVSLTKSKRSRDDDNDEEEEEEDNNDDDNNEKEEKDSDFEVSKSSSLKKMKTEGSKLVTINFIGGDGSKSASFDGRFTREFDTSNLTLDEMRKVIRQVCGRKKQHSIGKLTNEATGKGVTVRGLRNGMTIRISYNYSPNLYWSEPKDHFWRGW